ncbi:MAG: asparaginase [Pseudomonadales bacterium]|nr:asparaginase [Pseudomonadales bacterium]
MTKKIIVITTGGTIGSILKADSVSIDPTAQHISQEIEQVKNEIGLNVEVRPALNKSSESFKPTDWITVIQAINDALTAGASAIVVTHVQTPWRIPWLLRSPIRIHGI